MQTRAPLIALLAAVLLGVLTAVPGGPARIDAAFAAAPEGRLVVTWRDAAPSALALDGVASVARSRLNEHRSLVVAKGGEAGEVAARLVDDPRVESVVPDAIGRATDWPTDLTDPSDALWISKQADMRLIGMPAAWPYSTGSPGVVVAVLDTGYDGSHEDLAHIPTTNKYNARTGSKNVTDGYGHGTHVAGTIAAGTNNATGVAGIAPGVTIMPVKVLDANGFGFWSDFLEGVDWAVAHGADLVNMSLGSELNANQVSAWQPTFTAARNAGTLVVAAAGNNSNNNLFYPASFANVLSVAATNNGDEKAPFSNWGTAIDVAAPGVTITSTFPDDRYVAMSGTSMATPHVAGLAALIWSVHPEFAPIEVETAIKATALDLGAAGRDNTFGHGRIRAALALAWVPPDVTAPIATLLSPGAGASSASETVSPMVSFDEPVTGVDATSVRLRTATGTWLDGIVTYDGGANRATLDPTATLSSRTAYEVVVGGAIEDLAGNALIEKVFAFTTGDTFKPTVINAHPTAGSVDVARGVTITIELSEKVHGVSGQTVKLRNEKTGDRVAATVTYDKATRTISIDPDRRLDAGRWYRVKLQGGIEDLAGNNLGEWGFTFKSRA